MLEAALRHAEAGWRVLPLFGVTGGRCECDAGSDCHRAGKHPRLAGGAWIASRDPDQIRRWWTRWPTANIGGATGSLSGFLVLDVDGPAGDLELENYPPRPATRRHRTGRSQGGYHEVCAWPGRVGCSQGTLQHVNIRGDGGYVVLPPSTHASGLRYQADESPVAEAPAWLVTLAGPAPGPKRLLTALAGKLLEDPLDVEQDDRRRHADPRYRRRHRAVRSIAMSLLQNGWTEPEIVDLIFTRSTLRHRAELAPDPAQWVAEIVRGSARYIEDNPATPPVVLSRHHAVVAASTVGLTGSEQRLLAAHERQAQLRGEGRYEFDVRTMAAEARMSVNTARKHLKTLLNLGWIEKVFSAGPGDRRANRYRLAVPSEYRQIYRTVTDEPEVTHVHHPPCMTGSVSKEVEVASPVWLDHDAFARGCLAATVPVLHALRQANGSATYREMAAALDCSVENVRRQVRRLDLYGLVTRERGRARLVVDWESRLDEAAELAGSVNQKFRALRKRDAQRAWRSRQLDQRDAALIRYMKRRKSGGGIDGSQ